MDRKFVINIGRQLGSGGRTVGRMLAERLDAGFYDKELIREASRQSGLKPEVFERADERRRFSLQTLLGGVFPGLLSEDYLGTSAVGSQELFTLQSEVIRRLAGERSCIFVGRCADYVLREHPLALNVFVCADATDRQARVMELTGLDADKALELMARTDRQRAAYYNFYSGKTWGASASYHLCVNSSALGVEGTADMILDFARRKLGI